MAKLKKRKTSKSKKEKVQELDVEPITCKLLGIKEWSYSSAEGDLLRFGRYHSSTFPEVELWGSKRWVVGAYIMVDYESLREEGKTDDEIVQGCIKFLNQPPPRRKFQRKVRKPTYGNLQFCSNQKSAYINTTLRKECNSIDNDHKILSMINIIFYH